MASLGLQGCSAVRHRSLGAQPSQMAPALSSSGSACFLPAVTVSTSREIRTVVGLRPFRPSGFVVRAERINETLVVHNYGHGGGGITLSWGTAQLALDLGLHGYQGRVAVLGAGAVGLATARLLQEEGYSVTVYAKDLPPNTTSNIAGGQWFPFSVSDPNNRTVAYEAQLLAAARFAYTRYQILPAAKFGIRWMRNYLLSDDPPLETGYLGMQSVLRSMMPELRDLAPGEHPFTGFKQVRQFDGMLIEPPIYMNAMLEDFQAAGGTTVVQDLRSREEIVSLREKLVFNCTGLGAKALFDDAELTPIRGQLTFLLPQPEVQYATMFRDYYMFPRTDGILLGGTHDRGVWSLDPDSNAKQKILTAHASIFSSFRKC